ncbi:hypothetical protein HER10_EVM0008571 [Colletotrichum scovillei]|uniref:uncharacterized protein n=1 Tax=Colletotrichum scovillei TaxID=1209932 RepID=UPI0015C2C572|nr:uncharacterized protein HER10_EVM0008571 [Colletotrichum scovillei]KAF4778669.1 hypothetical protein HER10_EVM0008571 [Colletotrichum scovillei]
MLCVASACELANGPPETNSVLVAVDGTRSATNHNPPNMWTPAAHSTSSYGYSLEHCPNKRPQKKYQRPSPRTWYPSMCVTTLQLYRCIRIQSGSVDGRPAMSSAIGIAANSNTPYSVYTVNIPAIPLVSNRITSLSSRRHNLHKDSQVQQAEVNTSYSKGPFRLFALLI